MKINKAKGAAALLFLLHKLKILSEKRYDRMVDDLTVRSLKHQMEEERDGRANEDK